MTATSFTLSLSLLVAALGSCAESQPAPRTAAEAATPAPHPGVSSRREPPQGQTQTARVFMRDHAGDAYQMRRSVIAGRFDLIHRASADMAGDAWSSNLRAEYVPHVTAVRRAASAALEARSMPAAGAALGELGAACASCHREHGGPEEPSSSTSLADGVGAMAIHAAAERALWEGLFIPSEASWKRGAQRLAEAPELSSETEEVNALGRQLRDLAQHAAALAPSADLYGSIIATCSTCHRRLSIEPR